MKYIIACILCLLSSLAIANDNVVNVYNWSRYMPDSVLAEFEKETGIHVNYTVYDSNETLYAKLRSDPDSGYDIIVPSSYYIDRLRQAGILHKIDKSKLPNFKNINPALLHQAFDPNNDYCIPYLWGSTGIGINRQYFQPGSITKWSDLWKPKFKNQLTMLDDMREVFDIALITLGYSVNDQNPEHIKQAYQKLVQLLPNIRLFNSDAVQNLFVDEDIRIGMLWNGDLYQASTENSTLQFVYPEDGFAYWIDTVAIPKNAPHLANAYKFLNFIMRPDIAKEIALGEGYSSPNTEAIKLMPADIRNNAILNPPAEVLKRGQLQRDAGAADDIYEKYWELLKIGGE